MTRLFNDAYFASPEQNESSSNIGSLHQFSSLPKEIRLRIWSLALQPRRRFIPIRIELTTKDHTEIQHNQSQLYSTRNHMGNIISGSYYELAINESDANHAISPILSIAKESRWAALDCFRICLPLAGNRHLRVNPDYDVLYFHSANYIADINLLAAILHDIRAYDPRDQGLMHLAIQEKKLFPDEQLFTEIVGRDRGHETLDAVVCSRHSSKTRVYAPSFFDKPVMMPQWMETLPILPPMSTLGISYLDFEWLENDPRPVEPDISRMPFFEDPRRYHHSWKMIEEALDVRHTASFRIYVCVSCEIDPANIWRPRVQHTGEKVGLHLLVESYRQLEKKEWQAGIDYWPQLWNEHSIPSESFDEASFRESHVKVERNDMTAIGMWVFPGEALGQVNNDNFSEVYKYKKAIKSTVTPGLALFNLASPPL